MNILPSQKIAWHNLSSECKTFSPILAKDKSFGDITMELKQDCFAKNGFLVSIKDKLDKVIGFESLSMNEATKSIHGNMICVDENARRTGSKFGEILHLLSLMFMNENKSPKFEIYSRDTAVYFHSKYKFEPRIRYFDVREKIFDLMKNGRFEDLGNLTRKVEKCLAKNPENIEMQQDAFKTADEMTKIYIERTKNDSVSEKMKAFDTGIDMVLTKERLKENKEFFNNLYKKHGIDYKI